VSSNKLVHFCTRSSTQGNSSNKLHTQQQAARMPKHRQTIKVSVSDSVLAAMVPLHNSPILHMPLVLGTVLYAFITTSA
jgi:hypothetical protein